MSSPPVRPGARQRIAIPWLRSGHVARGRLLDRLDQAQPGDVVLVSAPAGWGKTALLADWLRTDPVHTVWVSLSPIDDSGRGFWAILLAALRACPVVAVGNALHDLVPPDDPAADLDFLAAVADGLHAAAEPLTIVLDNTQDLTDPAAVDGLRSLLRDRPPHVRVVLAGRRDPPIHRGRLRAEGSLVEVRAEQLRFTGDEAAAMLAATGYVFELSLVAALVAATGGWAAGLRLAAPALAAATPTDFVNDLVGTDRAMSDYLVEEVLGAFSAQTRHVLDRVSICDTVSAPLAATLCDASDVGEVLDALERETGLVCRTGAGQADYVVEPLLRAHLLADLRRRHPEVVVALHERAARWFASEDMLSTAVDHAVASGSEPLLVDLVRRYGLLLLAAGEHARLRGVASRLRPEVLTGDPMLALLAATACLEVGELDTAERLLAAAVQVWPADPAPELVALRRVAFVRRESMSAEHLGAASEAGIEAAGRLGLGPMAVVERAFLAMAEQRVDTARELAQAALEQAGANDYLAARCLTVLSAAAGIEGDFPQMAALAERADAKAPPEQWHGTIASAVTSHLRAYRALLLGRPAESLKLAEPALALAGPAGDDLSSVLLNPTLAAIRGAAMTEDGEVAKGLELLAAARAATDEAVPALYQGIIAVLEYRTAIDLGYVERAREVLDWASEQAARHRRGAGDAGASAVPARSHRARGPLARRGAARAAAHGPGGLDARGRLGAGRAAGPAVGQPRAGAARGPPGGGGGVHVRRAPPAAAGRRRRRADEGDQLAARARRVHHPRARRPPRPARGPAGGAHGERAGGAGDALHPTLDRGDRRRAHGLAQHREDPRPHHLRQARGAHPARGPRRGQSGRIGD